MIEGRKKSIFSPTIIFLLFMLVLEGLSMFMIGNRASFIALHQGLLFVLILACIILGIRERYVINPYFCLILFPFSLLIYDENVSTRFLIPLMEEMYPLCGASTVLYMLGIELFASRVDTRGWFVDQDPNPMSNEYFLLGVLIFGVWCVFALARIVGVTLPATSLAMHSVFISIVCFVKSRRRAGYYLIGVITVLLLAQSFRKTFVLIIMFEIMLAAFSSVYITRKQMSRTITIVILCILFMIFIVYPAKIYIVQNEESWSGLQGVSRLDEALDEDTSRRGTQEGSGIFASNYVLRPYLTFTTEWTNMSFNLDEGIEKTNGLFFIRPFLSILQMNTDWPELYCEPYHGAYNTYTYLLWQIRDFGYWGGFILTFFEGLLCGWMYKLFREHPYNPFFVVLYSYLVIATVEMFFNNHFIHGGIHIILLWVLTLSFVVKHWNTPFYNHIMYTTNMAKRLKMQMRF